jgi:hypothetical protein
VLACQLKGERVFVSGQAVASMAAEIALWAIIEFMAIFLLETIKIPLRLLRVLYSVAARTVEWSAG